MSACNTFTEHVWKPGECKNCFKPKSLHCLAEGGSKKGPSVQPLGQQNHPPPGARPNTDITNCPQRGGISARSGQFRPPVAKKPTIAVKPTMMLSLPSTGLDLEGNHPRSADPTESNKTSAFTVWSRDNSNQKKPGGPNNNDGDSAGNEVEGYRQCSPRVPSGNNNNNGLSDVLKEIAGLGSGPSMSSREDFLDRISSSYRRSLERGMPASSCLAIGSGSAAAKRVSLSDSTEIISTEGGRFCYPSFSSDTEEEDDDDGDDDDDDDDDDDGDEEQSDQDDDGEHESWDESDEELLAMEIRMRGQPRFANFRAATLSPVNFTTGKKWNTVPLRNRSLQRICAVDYDDSFDDILDDYPSMNSNGSHGLLPYSLSGLQGSRFLSNSESTTSPESYSSLPEDSRTSSNGSSAPSGLHNGLHSPSANREPTALSSDGKEPPHRALNSPKATETHKAVLAIRLEDKDASCREGGVLPQALPGQPITISFSPTEEQAKPYRVVNLEKPPICKPYTVVDVSASMANTEEHGSESTPTTKGICTALSPPPYPGGSRNQPLSITSPVSPKFPVSAKSPVSPKSPVSTMICPTSQLSPVTPMSPTTAASTVKSSAVLNTCKKSGNIRYQEVWTSSTSPRQKIPKVELVNGGASGSSAPPRQFSHKSAPTSPIAGQSSSRTVPVKSPNLSEIKFNSYNNAGMPPFPIIIHDEPTYARSSKNAVKVPIVINPSAYDNLAVYKSFLGLSGELPQPKTGTSGRVVSHTYEEIGSSESVQASPTERTACSQSTPEKPSVDSRIASSVTAQKPQEVNTKTTIDSSTSTTASAAPTSPTANPASSPLSGSQVKSNTSSVTLVNSQKPGSEVCPNVEGNGECQSSGSALGQREKASTVLSQIVASIQPPLSPPESPCSQSKACSSEELYSVPPDATKETLSRPKSLFSPTDGCLSKPRKDTPSKQLPKSQSASAALPPTSPKSESSAPFPPPRSTSSPYHASNLLQRHFSNWAKPASSSHPGDGEISPGGEGRRSESAKPKRWISFKSFFRRRKDEDEQKERIEREKEKGKLVGLDGTVITMLPPPPIQRQHWFAEAKTDDPNQKPTIIFTYKPENSTTGDMEGEVRIEEGRDMGDGKSTRSLSSGQSTQPHSRASLLISKVMSQVPSQAAGTETPTTTSLPAKLDLSTSGLPASSTTHAAAPSEGSVSLGEPEEGGSHSHSPASSSCSATYTNLGQSRANMIPQKHPRNLKTSEDPLALAELDSKATPPPLPKKVVGRSNTEPSALGKELLSLRPKGEAKPGGTNLSVANPLYDLDSTWETASQSSSLSSEARLLDQESGDSLERPAAAGGVKGSRPANSLSCLASSGGAATVGRERRGCRSAESLAGRARTTGRGGGSTAKTQRPALYKGMDSWEEVVGRIRGLHTDTLRKLAAKCEDRFMAGQKDHLRFDTDSWSHFRLTTGKPCCEAGDAVYYTASYAKDPLVNYAIKICRYKVKETQQQFFHSLAVRQSLAVHFNIQQDCGHFLADVPVRLLPWEEEKSDDEGEDEKGRKEEKPTKEEAKSQDVQTQLETAAQKGQSAPMQASGQGKLLSRVVVITREVPFQTVADFVREGVTRHARNPELYERQVCLLLLQLCSGLEHMKPYHVTHCDLRLENLLMVHCHPGNPWNLDIPEPNNNSSTSSGAYSTVAAAANSACPARLIISNFSQAKQKNMLVDAETLRDQSRLAPELLTTTQYRKCDEFQTGILIYEMLHQPNPFEEAPELKEREYTWADLPPLPNRSLYSQGLQRLAGLLLNVNPSERIQMAEARACLQCLLWGPREDLFQALNSSSESSSGPGQEAMLQNWLDLKRTLLMIKFAERSLDSGCGVSLEDWLCCQYLAFATPDSLSRVIRILQQSQNQPLLL